MQPYGRAAIQVTAATLLIASAAVAAGDGRPAASLSGTIAYTVSSGNSAHLWQMDLASGSKRRLTRASQREQAPSWSPDGRRIVYLRGKDSQIAVLNVRSGAVRVLTRGNVFDEDPAWSPDGRQIAWTRTTFGGGSQAVYSEIWVMRSGGGGMRRLTHNGVGDLAPDWSPDGSRIAFTRYRGQNTEARGIWVMRRGGKGERRLIRNGSRSAWSPDGRRIAYGHVTRRTAGNCGCRVTNLMVADARGRNRRLLVRNGGRPTWSPDGKRIVFQRIGGDETHLWIVRSDGTGLRRLTAGSNSQHEADWRPRR